jgi:zinc transporter 1
VALCLSIFLEAIQRFVEPQEVSQPKLVLIVGCLGLASNILGLFLFHDHGHGAHSHDHGDVTHAAEEGHGGIFNGHDEDANEVADEGGNIADILPQNRVGPWPRTKPANQQAFSHNDEDTSTAAGTSSPVSVLKSRGSNSSPRRHRKNSSASRSRYASVDNIIVHPASFRQDIIAASRLEDIDGSASGESENDTPVADQDGTVTENSPLLGRKRSHTSSKAREQAHTNHKHRQPRSEETGGGSHGHSHGDLNMRGVFLHVMGDALGNIGVIASALFIWLTDFWWRFYSDPLISLIITVIILLSAIPLCRAAARILLQAVPHGLSVDDIKEDIEDLPGVVSCHHLHVWQLSDTKFVASLHVQVAFDYNGADAPQYMKLAKSIRTCLHEYGIHSSTIQPEFCLDDNHDHTKAAGVNPKGQGDGLDSNRTGTDASREASIHSMPDACLLDCEDACGNGKKCCTTTTADTVSKDGDNHTH